LQGFDQGFGLGLTLGFSLFWRAATDVSFDGVELGDPSQRLCCDWGQAILGEV
jgi:hypothetical protein